MNRIYHALLIFILCCTIQYGHAHINPEKAKQAQNQEKQVQYRNDCAQATAQVDMSINNVRARLLNGGDVWWDLDDGKYIVPKVDPLSGIPEVSALFAGAVWLGGFDDVGNLKMAAQDFRTAQNNDFWPGPLTSIGTTASDTCENWDRFFRVQGENIRAHIQAFEEARALGTSLDCDAIPEDIRGWPGKGNEFFFDIYGFDLPFDTQGLGSFHDEDKDGLYNPCMGDYPVIEIRGCDAPNFPDEMIFWVYNDAGNIHTNTQGEPIRMEVQVQAFAYATNDEINNMTFQRYKLINRAVSPIDSTFFAMWVDPDLGCFTDDYIGCDTTRSLMVLYNEDAFDGTTGCDCPSGTGAVNTYCDDIPALGVDYFRGPRGPVLFTDTVPLDWDPFGADFEEDLISILDTVALVDEGRVVRVERRRELGMSSFTYYMNPGTGTWPVGMTDPQAGSPIEFYRYISGSWRDGTPYSSGGTGYNIPPTGTINYAFPDPPNDPSGWSMCTANLPMGDRRTIQASGPFRLDPGEVNELIIGVVWVPSLIYPCPDITELFNADEIAQALFDNCFILPDGPDAPDLDFIELDRELILIMTNDSLTSNNAFEEYAEKGLEIPELEEDSLYVFEGYRVYQLVGPNVTLGELGNIERAREIIQVDIKNGVNTIYNWRQIADPNPENEPIWLPDEQVVGADEGIRHTFRILEDQFAADDRRLVNHKRYYYTAIAYAYNNYDQFDPRTAIGQRRPYLEGRNNIMTYGPIPRPIVYQNLRSMYGEGPIVTRLSGEGAGMNFLDIADASRDEILSGSFDGTIEYNPGAGPIRAQVYNPLDVRDGEYILEFFDADGNDDVLSDDARWLIYDVDDPANTIISERSIARLNEQIIAEYGFSIILGQSDDAGDRADDSNGAIGATLDYLDPDGPQWLSAVTDDFLGNPIFNFIKTTSPESPDFFLDPTQGLSTIGNGFFVPYQITDYRRTQPTENQFGFMVTPAWFNEGQAVVRSQPNAAIQNLNNVDIVFTSDKSLWSRCIVVETANEEFIDLGLNPEGDSDNMELRDTESVGKEDSDGDGKADPDGEDLTGFGWFPGYAIDVETGQRLNIFFGENSLYNEELASAFGTPANGNDMIWNPSSDIFISTGGFPTVADFPVGGYHFVYVTNMPYDSCLSLRNDLRPNGNQFGKWRALSNITWTCIPLLAQGTELLSYNEGLIPNEATVKLRVDNPYQMAEGLPEFENYPAYRIEFRGVEAMDLAADDEVNEALDQISVAPNPYYGFSEYETSQFSNIVKITNLPAESTVTIFSIDGRFIRQYRRNESGIIQSPPRSNPPISETQIVPDIEWDLRNNKGIPVSSGVYLIHIDAPGLGERVIKWFGVNRKFDPTGL